MAAIGIDLGTTNSCVAVYRNGSVKIIANDQGNRVTPSWVAFTDSGRLVGEAAVSQTLVDPQNTLYGIKRLLGRRSDDPAIQDDLQRWPFKVSSDGGRPRIHVRYRGQEKVFSPEEICSQVVAKLRQTAETYLGQEVQNVVLTVPAFFNDSQRQATKDAGTIAGLHVMGILNEPTAAALAYGMHRTLTTDQRVVVFDLGGGTLDVSVLTIDKGSSLFEVKSTAGDTHLGGVDLDNRLAEYLAQDFRTRHSRTLTGDAITWRRLLTAAELAKRALSACMVTTVTIDGLCDGITYSVEVTRTHFEELCVDLFSAMLQALERALAESLLDRGAIDEIILVGGSTRIPKIQSMLQTFFRGKELNLSINPDEAVAYGAAIQAAILAGTCDDKLQDLQLKDVTPFSLGVELAGGTVASVIERNTNIPCQQQRTFSTHVDNQSTVDVAVFEGERPLTQDNNLLGRFHLSGIPPAASGAPEIIVTFVVDANGILEVSAKEKRSGRSRHITVEGNKRNLSSVELQRMLSDAERYRREDDDARNRAQARNRLESHCFALRTAASYGQLPDEQCKRVRSATQCVMSWLGNNPNASCNEYECQHRRISTVMANSGQALEPVEEEVE